MMMPNLQHQHTPSHREERSRERFDRWLQTQSSHPSISWEYEPNGPSTAPDYLLTLDGRKFAVEVTTIMHQKRVGDDNLSVEGVWSAQRNLVRAAERECVSNGVLTGEYYVVFTNAVPNLSRIQKKAIEELIKYVADTQTDDEAAEQPIVINGVLVCKIVKMSNLGGCLCLNSSMDREVSTGTVPLCDLLRDKVHEKAEQLGNVPWPLILLLDEKYYPEPPPVWFDCLDNYPPAATFHTIFVVREASFDFAIRVGEAGWPVLHRYSDMPS